MTPPDATDQLAVMRVLALYCQRCDDGRFDAVSELFTPDATFSYGGRSWTGRDEIISFFQTSQTPERRGKHVTANPVVEIDGDRAVAVSDFVFFGFADGALEPRIAGRYNDQLARTDDSWSFSRRDITTIAPAG